MPDAIPREIRHYVAEDKKVPFQRWMDGLKGQEIFRRILKRLDQVEDGNLGDNHHIQEGVWELRIFDRGAHRVYYGEDKEGDTQLVILLMGGRKDTQQSDIAKAVEYWRDYNA